MIASRSHDELRRVTGRPVRIGFVGAGNVLPAYLQVLDRLVPRGLAEAGPVCAPSATARATLAARRPGLELVSEARDVLEADVDVVVVLTPAATHAAIAAAAIEQGRHVLVEKPVGLSRAEAEPVFAQAAARGLHVLAAPFVQLSPTLRELWTHVAGGAIGTVHTLRGLYGNPGSNWASWYHEAQVGPLAEAGIYNLKSAALLAGPVVSVQAAEATAQPERTIDGQRIASGPAVVHVIVRHRDGALTSIVASQAIGRYRRPGLEVYGTTGTANLLGDDWDPTGFELWREETGRWEQREPLDATWLWADGLRELVQALRDDRAPLTSSALDLHLIDVLDAARRSVRSGRAEPVESTFAPLPLALDLDAMRRHLHDHTRPADEQ